MRRVLFWVGVVLVVTVIVAYVFWPRPLSVETARCRRGEIRVFVSEEAETRLDNQYLVAMPVAGRLLRTELQEGQVVQKGSVIARVDTFERKEQFKMLEAGVREVEAFIIGVDKAKPKPEEIRAAEIRVEQSRTDTEIVQKEVERARVNFEQEKKQYERSKELWAEQAISDSEYDEAERQYGLRKAEYELAVLNVELAKEALANAVEELKRIVKSVDDNEYMRLAYRAQIERIGAEMALLNDELAKSEIRAPVTGPILEEYQEDEQVLAAGTPLLKIGDLSSIRIESDILSEDLGLVKVGQDVEVYGPAVGPEPITGAVERIYPSGREEISSLGIEQQRVKIIIAFDNSRLQIRPAVRVDIRVITERKQGALTVPERALFKLQGRWHAFVVREGRARLTAVEVGLRTDETAEILGSLQEGDLVILSPPAELTEGAGVLPKPEG